MKRRQDDLEAVRAAIANGGAMTIYKTLLSISSDPTTPAQARVGACATIVRMSGLFEDAKKRPASDEDATDRSAPEWHQIIERLTKERDRLDTEIAERQVLLDGEVEPDVFG